MLGKLATLLALLALWGQSFTFAAPSPGIFGVAFDHPLSHSAHGHQVPQLVHSGQYGGQVAHHGGQHVEYSHAPQYAHAESHSHGHAPQYAHAVESHGHAPQYAVAAHSGHSGHQAYGHAPIVQAHSHVHHQQQYHHQPHYHHAPPPVQKVILREHVHVHNIHKHNLHKHLVNQHSVHEANVHKHNVHVVPIREKIVHNYDHHQTKVIPHHETKVRVIPTYHKVVKTHHYAEKEHPIEINHGWRQEHAGWQ